MADLDKLKAETARAQLEERVAPGKQDVLEDLLRTLEGHPALFDPKAVAVVKPLLVERVELGKRRYGVGLQTFNGRDAHLDELAEQLDGIMYGHQAAMQYRALEAELEQLRGVLAEEHARVLELQRERDELREKLDERTEAVDCLRRELDRARAALEAGPTTRVLAPAIERLNREGHGGPPVVLVLPDDPATRSSLLDVLGQDLAIFGQAGVEVPLVGPPRALDQGELRDAIAEAGRATETRRPPLRVVDNSVDGGENPGGEG